MSALIGARFNGPAASANGGYACGVFAGLVQGPAAVTLHVPPPLGVPLEVERGARRTHVLHCGEPVATVAAAADLGPVVPAVGARAAEAAHAGFAGRAFHPFPSCFVCGLDRADGLNLTPGPVPDAPGTVACVWRPDSSVAGPDGMVRPEVVWAALDCPGGWTGDPARQARVLGRMAARIGARPSAGDVCVLVARSEPVRGRTVTSHTALYRDGALLASATAIWIAVRSGDVLPDGAVPATAPA
ncbi:hypothetical protein [Actinocorallia aurantiaca]|uniref:Thioesterase superfamily protein n=1 Tax=Actinocorallia aurantiaca TaxID=46204 RepID=A0ABP6H558_9ACTN